MLLHAPTPLRLADLTALTERIAAEVRAGRHAVVVDPDRRWYQQLCGDRFVDVWLISWATEQAAELHDHAGSLGALTVVTTTGTSVPLTVYCPRSPYPPWLATTN